MKLRSRILQIMLVGVVIAITLVAFLSFTFVRREFAEYVKLERQQRLDQILADVSKMYSENPSLTPNSLADLAFSEQLSIEVSDAHGVMIGSFNGIAPGVEGQGEYTEQNVPIMDAHYQMVGQIKIGYWDNALLTQAARSFFLSLIRAFGLAAGVAAVCALLFSVLFSKRIVSPIQTLMEQTTSIRYGEYTKQDPARGVAIEVDRLSENINALSAALEQQEKTRKQYAQDISHELRTPVTALKLQLAAMRDGIVPLDTEACNFLLEETDRLNRLIEMLRQSFANENIWGSRDIQTVSLQELIEGLAQSVRPLIEHDGSHFEVEVPHPWKISTDPETLRHILYNLLSNARKAIHAGGTVRLHVRQEKEHVLLSVTDNGVGIRPEDLDRIFERFYRVDDARNTKMGGTGLGLAIAKNMTASLHGTLRVQSEYGEGSTFTVTLPLRFPKEPKNEMSASS